MKKFLLAALVLVVSAGSSFALVSPMEKMATTGIADTPTNFYIVADYDVRTDGQPVYLGMANRGASTSDSVWIVYKFTYDVSNQMTARQSAYGAWLDRATLTYQ